MSVAHSPGVIFIRVHVGLAKSLPTVVSTARPFEHDMPERWKEKNATDRVESFARPESTSEQSNAF